MKPTNVRPGDRAVIVSSIYAGNVGVVVDVLHEYTGGSLPGTNGGSYVSMNGKTRSANSWVVESLGRAIVKIGTETRNLYPEKVTVMADHCLRPLRDGDGTDEMVSRVGKAPVSNPLNAIAVNPRSKETSRG